MSEWSGIDDDENNADNQNVSPLFSPFSAAFRTPRSSGIQTGVRDVPPAFSEHPEDLYDALQVEFKKAIINNLNRRNKTRLTFKERGYMIRYLIMTDINWKELSPLNKGS
jgi:hypothetical protein